MSPSELLSSFALETTTMRILKLHFPDQALSTLETFLHLAPYGRTTPLDRHTPWSRRCIRDTQSSASRRYIHHGMWPRQ